MCQDWATQKHDVCIIQELVHRMQTIFYFSLYIQIRCLSYSGELKLQMITHLASLQSRAQRPALWKVKKGLFCLKGWRFQITGWRYPVYQFYDLVLKTFE